MLEWVQLTVSGACVRRKRALEMKGKRSGEQDSTSDVREETRCPVCNEPPSIHCLQARKNETDLTALVLDIHDGLVQNLFAAYTQVHALQHTLRGGASVVDVYKGLERVAMLLECSLREIRTFVHAFGPDALDDHDLCRMVEDLVEQRRELTDMNVHVQFDGEFPTPPLPIRVALYRILQEALSNAYRHARATRVDVHLYRHGPILGLRVSDNGRGFDATKASSPTESVKHLGLRGIRERVHTLGGTFHVTSKPGQGTTLQVEFRAYSEE